MTLVEVIAMFDKLPNMGRAVRTERVGREPITFGVLRLKVFEKAHKAKRVETRSTHQFCCIGIRFELVVA